MRPDPPLFPADPDQRAAVEEAERWGETVLQDAVRRILWNALKRDRAPLASYAEGARLGVPIGLAVKTAAPIVASEVRINEATDEPCPGRPGRLPGVARSGSTAGSPRACSAATSRPRPTSRSPPACAWR